MNLKDRLQGKAKEMPEVKYRSLKGAACPWRCVRGRIRDHWPPDNGPAGTRPARSLQEVILMLRVLREQQFLFATLYAQLLTCDKPFAPEGVPLHREIIPQVRRKRKEKPLSPVG